MFSRLPYTHGFKCLSFQQTFLKSKFYIERLYSDNKLNPVVNRRKYLEEEIDSKRDNIGNPEILFVEQRLLRMCYKDMGVLDKCSPLIDVVWGAHEGQFLNPEHRSWEFFDFDNSDIATHTWIAKQAIERNVLYQNYMCVRLIEKILEIDNRYYDVLKDIKEVKPYIRLLDQYLDSEGLVQNKQGSKVLYKK